MEDDDFSRELSQILKHTAAAPQTTRDEFAMAKRESHLQEVSNGADIKLAEEPQMKLNEKRPRAIHDYSVPAPVFKGSTVLLSKLIENAKVNRNQRMMSYRREEYSTTGFANVNQQPVADSRGLRRS